MKRLTERRWTSKDNTRPTVELISCGHCGGDGEIIFNRGNQVYVKCKSCGMQTPLCDFQTEAVAIWNKRTDYGEQWRNTATVLSVKLMHAVEALKGYAGPPYGPDESDTYNQNIARDALFEIEGE
jgi:ribosomal protein S27E